jgi:hypothetical protein
MRFLRRQKTERDLADYRQVADAVHERRKARREAEESLSTVDTIHDAARSYAPNQRLQSVSANVRRLHDDCEGMPRTWDRDPEPPDHFWLAPIRWGALIVAGAGAALVWLRHH